ncbi:other/FunK1 protein kinase [Coprinopsis cinerea okayama7|uniref:Other/FunK1 protein kinase n=1 Tax=Coprinopsis cinerea (strain Okayama-7 / 130 / ATCC MYA-4618 / FGSC 9003) TaxID=240176 RepID=D6RPP3_COPC7|nr:other/FunK1 protein kinase [Coprinopsis cinerea okayama7\|eukprot:XP_002910500.1 other/FunK1 protein kinase [Coprinopsis cinerea okayama7\
MVDLQDQKAFLPRECSLNQHSPSPPQRSVYSHALKAFDGLFHVGDVNPNYIVKSLHAIGRAVCSALEGMTGICANKLSVRPTETDNSADNSIVVSTCLTKNMDAALHPTDVVVPLRVSRRQAGENETMDEQMRDIFRIVNEDPRRTFAYGITVEDAQMSLWYLSRSCCIKSTPFNMTEHPDILVQIFTCLFTATDQQLGYDPLVTLLPDSSYVYELPSGGSRLNPLYYRTVELVSQFHSPDVTGRSSRIWRVIQVTSPSNPTRIPGTSERILKDTSLDVDVPTEAEIQEQLFHDIAAFGRTENWRSQGILKDMRKADIDELAEAFEGENFKRFFSCIIARHLGDPSAGSQNLNTGSANPSGKRRCFFVYELVCTVLHDIPTLGEVVDILKQCVTALRLMFCAGWVHRDVSSGNILAFPSTPQGPWQVKLSDLEFARKYPSPMSSADEPRVGTPYFMACELQTRVPFLPETGHRGRDRVRGPSKPVIHNYQHDLESVWWIFLWLVTMRIGPEPARDFGELFFQQKENPSYAGMRAYLFALPDALYSYERFPRTLPSSLYRPSAFLDQLNTLKIDLYWAYQSLNGSGSQGDRGSYSWIIGEGFSAFFEDIEKTRGDWNSIQMIVRRPLQHVHLHDPSGLSSSRKRNPPIKSSTCNRGTRRLRNITPSKETSASTSPTYSAAPAR